MLIDKPLSKEHYQFGACVVWCWVATPLITAQSGGRGSCNQGGLGPIALAIKSVALILGAGECKPEMGSV